MRTRYVCSILDQVRHTRWLMGQLEFPVFFFGLRLPGSLGLNFGRGKPQRSSPLPMVHLYCTSCRLVYISYALRSNTNGVLLQSTVVLRSSINYYGGAPNYASAAEV